MFPPVERVVYNKNPLSQVICQLRFPPILKIGAGPPVDFQEGVRGHYPLYSLPASESLSQAMPEALAGVVFSRLLATSPGLHQFSSADERWALHLAPDYLSLTTRAYQCWEEFRDRLIDLLHVLRDIYQPAFFSRIGLRYQDIIRRETLGLAERAWSDILAPHIAGVLSQNQMANQVKHTVTQTVIDLAPIPGQVRISHGLVYEPPTNQARFMIDSDFSVDSRTEFQDAIPRLNDFNQQAGRLFRWCIRDTLHEAMEPHPVRSE